MRGRLLDATVECLDRFGYAATTTTRVTELAGVTRGAQVHHFATRAELIAATVRHLMAMRTELAAERLDAVREAADPLDAALDLLWEVHHQPVRFATLELWMAARTDPDLKAVAAEVEPAAREAVAEFVLTVVCGTDTGTDADRERFRQVVNTAMYAVRGVLLSEIPVSDTAALRERWRHAKADLRLMLDAVLAQSSAPISGAR